ncbi:hypothetical protein PAAG_00275 [Paracoccidioides lutzii Pb01]|uniref:Uncharacterized protein n=1 Tax=Paracoccidioides lutzii (strain ATCC MYA-826 / Pb01) TaxID=502779 RepID=C1GP30_PARBA|nr:hypothetical protein PAAG_00275 [Paracoccidioides lutzii Pb01]EEH35952.2 hypothetical protein PAAG_00275 [Paracoccidioides lutzii Pb01]
MGGIDRISIEIEFQHLHEATTELVFEVACPMEIVPDFLPMYLSMVEIQVKPYEDQEIHVSIYTLFAPVISTIFPFQFVPTPNDRQRLVTSQDSVALCSGRTEGLHSAEGGSWHRRNQKKAALIRFGQPIRCCHSFQRFKLLKTSATLYLTKEDGLLDLLPTSPGFSSHHHRNHASKGSSNAHEAIAPPDNTKATSEKSEYSPSEPMSCSHDECVKLLGLEPIG